MNRIQARKIITSKNPTILELQDARRVLRSSCFQDDENLCDIATARINGAVFTSRKSKPTWPFAIIGLILAIVITLAVLPAFAQTSLLADRITVHHDADSGDAWYARIEIENKTGTYNQTRTYATAHGDVSVRYSTTRPSAVNDPASADPVCVVNLPDGVLAVPMCLDVMEQTTGTIFLMLYVGG